MGTGACLVRPGTARQSVNAENPERAALDLFDRLRLREPLAHAFEALGFEAEESWRVAARIKVALLIEAKDLSLLRRAPAGVSRARHSPPLAPPRIPILSPVLGRTRMFAGSPGCTKPRGALFVKESYEELLWWLQLPTLCKLAAESVPARSAIQEIGESISRAMAAAASAGYSLDALLEGESRQPEPATPASSGWMRWKRPFERRNPGSKGRQKMHELANRNLE